MPGSANRKLRDALCPRIRNIAGEDNILFGAFYFPWFIHTFSSFNSFSPGTHWTEVQAANGTTAYGTPLLGLYDSSDQNVINRHIDWAQGFGIDYFAVWFYGGVLDSRVDPLLQSPLMKDFKFSFLYNVEELSGGGDLTNPENYALVKRDFEYMAEKYFGHPSFLRINERPVVQWDNTTAIRTDIVAPIMQLREDLKAKGYDVYLIGEEMGWDFKINLKRLAAFDAISSYGFPQGWAGDQTTAAVYEEYSRWLDAAKSVNVDLIPSTRPGFDNRETISSSEATKYFFHFSLPSTHIIVQDVYLTILDDNCINHSFNFLQLSDICREKCGLACILLD